MTIFRSVKMAAVRRLGFVMRVFGPPIQRAFGGLNCCAKFVWNRQRDFENMRFLFQCYAGLDEKCPFTPLSGKLLWYKWGKWKLLQFYLSSRPNAIMGTGVQGTNSVKVSSVSK